MGLFFSGGLLPIGVISSQLSPQKHISHHLIQERSEFLINILGQLVE